MVDTSPRDTRAARQEFEAVLVTQLTEELRKELRTALFALRYELEYGLGYPQVHHVAVATYEGTRVAIACTDSHLVVAANGNSPTGDLTLMRRLEDFDDVDVKPSGGKARRLLIREPGKVHEFVDVERAERADQLADFIRARIPTRSERRGTRRERLAIVLGFAIVGISLYVLTSLSDDTGTTTKVIIGALGAIGAILANFIGAIYMKMFSETLTSLTEFHQRLVGTHHLHFGNFLTAKTATDTLRDETLAKVAEGMALQATAKEARPASEAR